VTIPALIWPNAISNLRSVIRGGNGRWCVVELISLSPLRKPLLLEVKLEDLKSIELSLALMTSLPKRLPRSDYACSGLGTKPGPILRGAKQEEDDQ